MTVNTREKETKINSKLVKYLTISFLLIHFVVKAENWAHWRGPNINGAVPSAKPPTHWSEKNNIRWKVPIDGEGASTPIIWKDKIFLLSVIDTGKVDPSLPRPEDQPKRVFDITHPNTTYEYIVLCLDRKSGKTLWSRVATRLIPHEGTHRDNNYASASPTTDGKLLYCWFGSAGLFCFTQFSIGTEKKFQRTNY